MKYCSVRTHRRVRLVTVVTLPPAGPHRARAAQPRPLLLRGHAGPGGQGQGGGHSASLRPAAAEVHRHQVQ